MQIRIGYVAIALNLPKVTSSSTVTYTNYRKQTDDEKKLNMLKKATLSNLNSLYKILEYNYDNEIHFYRITSALVPLATHPDILWNYRKIFKKDFEFIGNYIKGTKMRVDTHPDQFNVINSIKEDVVESTIRNLWFHVNLFNDIDNPEGKMVLHTGSGEGGKEKALTRFKNNFMRVPEEIRSRVILENDDKTFTAFEVLKLCNTLSIPMVLDVHHHMCNNGGEKLEELLNGIFNTWKNEKLSPKIHFSSPREGPTDRKHADFINPMDFVNFLEMAEKFGENFDVMLEAKMKDLALWKLIDDIHQLRPDWKWKDRTTLII